VGAETSDAWRMTCRVMLSTDSEGQHRIRINDQWRVCFVWDDGDAYDVEITDYH